MLLVNLPGKLNINVVHGWRILQGPFLVSKAQGQIVKSLDYRPTYEVYCQAIENVTDHKFNNADLFLILLSTFRSELKISTII
ncbi:MAG: hypothetical protein ACI9HU_000927 [Colwellia sp.]